VTLVKTVKLDFGGESKEFPLGVSILLYGSVASGKTTFSLTLAREFLKNSLPCVWVCLDESPQSVREKMEYFQIDYRQLQEKNLLRFIDIYTEQITGKPLHDPYIISCTSAFNLNEINRALMSGLAEVSGQGIVVFDSVSSLLLYNRSGTAEEFLKVHMSRITSAGFSGFFILQRDLHDQRTEETLKMMSDAVLEFGFEKDVRKIGIIKLPLGSSGEWIASSLFAWQQPPGITSSKPSGARKYMDSGGYLEEFKEGLVEGLKEGLSGIKIDSSAKLGGEIKEGLVAGLKESLSKMNLEAQERRESETDYDSQREPPMLSETQGGAQVTAGQQNLSGGQAQRGGQSAHQRREAVQRMDSGSTSSRGMVPVPTVQHIDKQIIVTELAGLPDKIGDQIKDLLNEQLKLRESINEKEEQTKESRKRLNILENKETQTRYEVKEIEQHNESVKNAIIAKKTAYSEMEAQKRLGTSNYQETLKRFEASKGKADAIITRKKTLESKIHDLVEGSGELYIDLAPYLQEVLAKREVEVAKSKESVDKMDVKLGALTAEIKLLEDELAALEKRNEDKKMELEDVRSRKAKVESELGLIVAARSETENKLKDIADKKKVMEEKIKELMGRSA
jgi:KaiC/GvpD/RAD55 family RecA-like ATPase